MKNMSQKLKKHQMKTRRILFVIAWLTRIKLKTSLKAFLSGMEFSVYIWLIHCAHGAEYKISIQPFNGCLVYENCLLYTFTLFQQKGSALKTLRLIPLFIFEQNMAFVLSIITKNEGINVYLFRFAFVNDMKQNFTVCFPRNVYIESYSFEIYINVS